MLTERKLSTETLALCPQSISLGCEENKSGTYDMFICTKRSFFLCSPSTFFYQLSIYSKEQRLSLTFLFHLLFRVNFSYDRADMVDKRVC